MNNRLGQLQTHLLEALLLALPATLQAQDPNFLVTINNNAATITAYTGPGGDVTIPGSIYITNLNAYFPVTTIGNNGIFGAFQNSSITSVSIPNSVTGIGGQSFENCTNLTSISTFPTVSPALEVLHSLTVRTCPTSTSLEVSRASGQLCFKIAPA